MPSESGNRGGGSNKTTNPAAAEQEHLPCPRCDSTNTKFCYYNNYNFSQPRHFCKSCRRYWTHGGTLRDIPVGGATRKNAKRLRTSQNPAPAATPLFTSLLNNTQGPAFLGLGGLGLEDMGFGLGRGSPWPFPGLAAMGNTWQFDAGEDCFSWPDLAISTPGNALK